MSPAPVIAPVVAQELKAKISARTTTTVQEDLPNVSGSWEAVRVDWPVSFGVVPYVRLVSRGLPVHAGKAILLEGTLEQIGYPAAAAVSSSVIESQIMAKTRGIPRFTPPSFHELDVVDWDAALEVAPNRTSRMLTVKIKYTGRGTPLPLENDWSD